MVITLPANKESAAPSLILNHESFTTEGKWCNAHLVVENLGFPRLSLGNEKLVQNIQNILADLLKLGLDLLPIVADGANVFFGPL